MFVDVGMDVVEADPAGSGRSCCVLAALRVVGVGADGLDARFARGDETHLGLLGQGLGIRGSAGNFVRSRKASVPGSLERPDSGHRAAGGDSVDQLHARAPVEQMQLTGLGVDRGDLQAGGPVGGDQTGADHSATGGRRYGFGVPCPS